MHKTFASLKVYNYRLYVTGQAISISGTWMQKVGQAWLILELSGSGTALGVTTALQHLPTLLISPWAGLLADRLDKRKILLVTQSISGVLAFMLAGLVLSGRVEVWMVMALACALGTTHAFDKPARHTFVMELVGPAQLSTAVTLNNVIFKMGMLVGPAIAGILIAMFGVTFSFFVNGFSFIAVVAALLAMRPDQMQHFTPAPRARGQLREGFVYVWRTPTLLAPILLMAVVNMLAWEWNVTLPLLAVDAFEGDASTLGTMYSAIGLGAVIGGLVLAGSLKSSPKTLLVAVSVFVVVNTFVVLSPSLPMAFVGLAMVGATTIATQSIAYSYLQLNADPDRRGRVIALLTVASSGTRPLGAPLLGWVGENVGARAALGVGSVAAALGAVWMLAYLHRRRALRPAEAREPETEQTPDDTGQLSAGVSNPRS